MSHWPEPPTRGFVGCYRFLSNFYSCKVRYEGQIYPSSEAAYQAAKTLDPDTRRQFVTMSPGEAKRAGRQLEVRSDWETIKIEVMWHCLASKFSDPDLRSKLLDTGDMELVERNTWGDRYWGQVNGVGENQLGRLLMQMRELIRSIQK